MRVLVACEFSGVVREAFRAKGHDAWSCDLLPTEQPGPHIQGDVLEVLQDGWDLMIAHPPCTYLTSAGARYWPVWDSEQAAAIQFVCKLWDAPIAHIAVENPVGILSKRWRKPSQIVHPYYFGDAELKQTCFWLRGLPILQPSNLLPKPEPRGYCIKQNGRRYNYYYHQGKTGHDRSRTFPGIAAAMADQWG